MLAVWFAALGLFGPVAPTPPAPAPAAAQVDGGVESHWYGGPAAVADLTAGVLVVWGLAAPDHAGIVPGGLAFGLGAPINHLMHRRPGRAAISFAARALAGVLVWPTFDDHIFVCDAPPCHDPTRPLALATLLLVGVMAADDALLARETVPRRTPQCALLSPGVLAAPGAAMLSLSGRF